MYTYAKLYQVKLLVTSLGISAHSSPMGNFVADMDDSCERMEIPHAMRGSVGVLSKGP